MPSLPTDPRLLNTLLTTTLDEILEVITDNFFDTNPLWMRLLQRNEAGEQTIRRGGAEIKVPILYDEMPAYSYGADQTFGTAKREFLTPMQFQWKRVAAECNFDAQEVAQNAAAGGHQLFDLVQTTARNSWMSLMNLMGYQIYGSAKNKGTGPVPAFIGTTPAVGVVGRVTPSATDWDGFYNGIDNSTGTFTTYGGLTRVAGPIGSPGAAINAQVVSAQGQPASLSLLQLAMGKAVFDQERPDLMVTTQDTWNDIWNRVQPQDRNAPGPLRDVGFTTINLNGMEMLVDSHVVPGDAWMLNTRYIRLYLMEGRDFVRRARAEGYGERGFPVPNQDKYIDQIICSGNLCVPGPRFHVHVTDLAVTT